MSHNNRRWFLQTSAALAAGSTLSTIATRSSVAAELPPGSSMQFGLVTYQWGRDWDLPTLIKNCAMAEVHGVELRTTHAHAVEPTLSEKQRDDVRRRFADSPVELVGIGSNERYDDPNPEVVKKAVEATKTFLRLSHDVGGTGVKVKPDRFHPNVPREKTIEQIGQALSELGDYGLGFGQEVRLEVHGQCAELPTIKAILDVADNDNVKVCWNSNPQDLQGEGLAHNFGLVRPSFGMTAHIHELNSDQYPYADLFRLLVASDYEGWLLLEASSEPADRVAALAEQRKLFQQFVATAQKQVAGK